MPYGIGERDGSESESEGASRNTGTSGKTPVVSLRDVVAFRGNFPVLAGVDLEVQPGEIVLLRGTNGSGKTTLLRLLAGLMEFQQGEAYVLGENLASISGPSLRRMRRKIGFVAHEAGIYGHLSARENVAYYLSLRGEMHSAATTGMMTARETVKTVAEVAEDALCRAGLQGQVVHTPAAKLSAGQQRRIGLAFAFCGAHREILLFDEPHTGLDANARQLLLDEVRTASRRGAAVVLSSHESAAAIGFDAYKQNVSDAVSSVREVVLRGGMLDVA